MQFKRNIGSLPGYCYAFNGCDRLRPLLFDPYETEIR